MKLFFWILFLALAVIACSKDDEHVSKTKIENIKTYVHTSDEPIKDFSRSGQKRPVYYLNSVSIDYFTMWPAQRLQIVFKKSDIANINLAQYDPEIVAIQGVDFSFYDLKITFINGKEYKDQVMAPVAIGSSISYNPNNVEMFSYPYSILSVNQNQTKQRYFDYKFGVFKNRFNYTLIINSDTISNEYINSLTSGSTFVLAHQ